jgi:AraC-like DNA-binding protein
MRRSSKPMLMRSQIVGPALRYVRESGGDQEKLVRQFGLDPSAELQRDIVLPLDDFRSFFDAAAREANDPLFGVHLARFVDRGVYGLLEWSPRLAPTVRDACRRIASYIRVSNDAVEILFDERADGSAALRQRVPGDPRALGRHPSEFFVALLLEEGRRLSGVAIRFERIWFPHAAPPVSLFEELSASAIEFGAGETGMLFSREVLDTPLLTSDPSLLSYLDRQALREVEALSPDPGILADVRRALEATLAAGAPSLSRTARGLGVSGRTLQRRLADAGASFQSIVDSAREEIARKRVASGDVSIRELATSLGYSHERAFLRAFKRWTGLTPSEYREKS